MTIVRFAIHHAWWLAALGLVSVGTAIVFRTRVARMMRLAKAAATDKRLPWPVRWLFTVALVVKCSPVDFGIDEVLLLVGVGLLAGPYRATWAEIRKDVR
jgi:NADH:ubiquinone oxidoreductase subunit 2 (subunit N)